MADQSITNCRIVLRVPNAYRVVRATRDDATAVGEESDRLNSIDVRLECRPDGLQCAPVEWLDTAVF